MRTVWIGWLLPEDPQHDLAHGSQLEAVHLLHVAVHWLGGIAALCVGVWCVGLLLAVLAWAAWGLAWLAGRLLRRDGRSG